MSDLLIVEMLALQLLYYFKHQKIIIHKLKCSLVFSVMDKDVSASFVKLKNSLIIGSCRCEVKSSVLSKATFDIQVHFMIDKQHSDFIFRLYGEELF